MHLDCQFRRKIDWRRLGFERSSLLAAPHLQGLVQYYLLSFLTHTVLPHTKIRNCSYIASSIFLYSEQPTPRSFLLFLFCFTPHTLSMWRNARTPFPSDTSAHCHLLIKQHKTSAHLNVFFSTHPTYKEPKSSLKAAYFSLSLLLNHRKSSFFSSHCEYYQSSEHFLFQHRSVYKKSQKH